MNDNPHVNTARYILGLLQNNCTIPGSAAENFVGAKQWLSAVANENLLVSEPPPPMPPPKDAEPPVE